MNNRQQLSKGVHEKIEKTKVLTVKTIASMPIQNPGLSRGYIDEGNGVRFFKANLQIYFRGEGERVPAFSGLLCKFYILLYEKAETFFSILKALF